MPNTSRLTKSLSAAIAAAATISMLVGTAGAATTCDLVASPTGSDSAAGSLAAPFQTAQKLVNALTPGQVGCLESGNYHEDVQFSHGGSAGAPITLTSYPGQTATVTGRMWLPQGSDNVTVTHLTLNGVNALNLPSPTINAANAIFSDDEVTNDHTAICFAVGSAWGRATNTLITRDRIHHCGVMPAANHDHGIYVSNAIGTRIEWNVIYDNADRGIQMYPNALNTTIDHNVITGNGEGIIFSGANGLASDNTNVYDNVVSGSVLRHDVESWYPSGNPRGTGNVFHNNCVWGGAQGTIDTSGGGFTARNNTIANPGFVNAAAHDYVLRAGSPCMSVSGNTAAVIAAGASAQADFRARATTARRAARKHRASRRATRSHRRANSRSRTV